MRQCVIGRKENQERNTLRMPNSEDHAFTCSKKTHVIFLSKNDERGVFQPIIRRQVTQDT